MSPKRNLLLLGVALVVVIMTSAVRAQPPFGAPTATLLVTGLEGGAGSTIGPGGARRPFPIPDRSCRSIRTERSRSWSIR